MPYTEMWLAQLAESIDHHASRVELTSIAAARNKHYELGYQALEVASHDDRRLWLLIVVTSLTMKKLFEMDVAGGS